MDNSLENDAFEIARRVMEGYGVSGSDERTIDLGRRIHRAASDLANERAIADNFDVPSGPDEEVRRHFLPKM